MTTIGDLTPNMIGRDRVRVAHEGATVEGELRALDIDTTAYSNDTLVGSRIRSYVDVKVTITLGSITLGPLNRDHPCEVIA